VTSTRPLVIGHRGASGYRPEHTAAAYELAFALGADAVEPDVVLSKDGVPVVRHENEISGTTDVADRVEFADRRTTKSIDGERHTGWFTEDFTWAELRTLRARERLASLRPGSATYDGRFGILRLAEVLRLVEKASHFTPRTAVVELKHSTYFDSIGLSLENAVAAELETAGWAGSSERLVVESFEKSALFRLCDLGVRARWIYLIEDSGTPFDQVARQGAADAAPYAEALTDAGLAALAGEVDGISLDKVTIMPRDGDDAAPATSDVVERAHRAGLDVFTWTLRAENAFLPSDYRVGRTAGGFGRWQDEFAALLATGVDGVFADQPDLAIAARESVGGAN